MITITFNKNNLDRPALSIARTFIHEMIHAEIFRKLLSVFQQPNLNITYSNLIAIKDDYPGLYDYYTRWKNNTPVGMNVSSAQHQAMAQHYRGVIKQTIQEFDNTQTNDIYEALSWIGLMGTEDYNSTTGLYSNSTIAWNSLSVAERLNIKSTISSFINNNSNCE